MLQLKYLFENYPLAKLALGNYAHDEEGLDDMLALFRISSNAVYPYRENGVARILRLAPAEEKSRGAIEAELEFISHLRNNGYPAMELIPTLSNERIATLDTEWGTWYSTAFKRVGGEQIEDTDFSPRIMFLYGEALAKLHVLSETFKPAVRRWTYEDALERIINSLSECGAPDFMQSEAEAVKRELAACARTSENFGLVHYDFEADNVFYSAESDSVGVIDFDDAMYHFFALDIEQALDSVEEEGGAEQYPLREAEFLRGYQSVRPLPSGYYDMRTLMRRFMNINGYADILTSVTGQDFANEPEWMTELKQKLARMLKVKERFASGR